MTLPPKKALSGDYKVGYSRPPHETRFRKGVSGNPGGRPRGMTAGRAKRLALQEAYRRITMREGDEVRILPTIQAVMRQQARSAAKGNGPAQRHFIDRVQAIEQEALTDEKTRLASLTHKGDAENPLLGPVTDADRIKALVALLQEHPEVLELVTANMKLLK